MNIDQITNPKRPATKEQLLAALKATMAVAEAIRELGEVPAGHLYATTGVTIEVWNGIIGTLKNAGLVSEQAHLLTWTGPAIA